MNLFQRRHQLRPVRPWRLGMRDLTMLATALLLVCLYNVGASFVDFTRTRQYSDWWSARSHIDKFIRGRFQAALDLPATMSLKRRLDPSRPDSGIIRMRLPKGTWELWQKDTPGTNAQWFDATIVRGSDLLRAKIRKRGDTSVHWMTEKKSFTLKSPRSSFIMGHRRLSFSNKEVLRLYLSNRLAGEFGLLAPMTTVAPVFVNDKYYGIFRVSEIINETFLRRHKRLPGTIFRADTAERGEYYKGLPRPVFANPYIWDRVAFNEGIEDIPTATLKAFLSDINGTTFDHHRRLMSRLDRDELSRLIAYLLIVGDLYHLSGVHNQFWYEDPSSGLLHPVPWDILLLDLELERNRINRCLRAICRDPFVIDGAAREIWNRLSEDSLYNTAEQLVIQIHSRFKDHFQYDRYRRHFISDVGTPDDTLRTLRNNLDVLKRWLDDCAFACYATWHSENRAILDIESRGRVGANLRAVELDGIQPQPETLQVIVDRNRNGVSDREDERLSGSWAATATGLRFTLTEPLRLFAGAEARTDGSFNPAPLHYRFFVEVPNHRDLQQPSIRPLLFHRFSGDPAKVKTLRAPTPVSTSSSWHPWQFSQSRPQKVQRFSGKVRLDQTLTVEPQDMLVIERGTTIELGPEVSILCHGRLSALGDSEFPITFRPTGNKTYWGALVLEGHGANQSTLRHVTFSGGGQCRTSPLRYTGMLSIHRADKVTIERCTFSQNVESDDALHAVHANLTVRDCIFTRIHADAIDLDYSSGSIERCRFVQCGNDAIDLMHSSAQIISNQISESADKGISIGESSHPIVFNNRITHCRHGIEVKDGSEPYLVNNSITDTTVAVAQIVKNWRYGSGGWAKIVYCAMSGNATDIQSDNRSRLTRIASGNSVNSELDTDPSSTTSWIYAHYGISLPLNKHGVLDNWSSVKPKAPLLSETFTDQFGPAPDHWIARGTHTRLDRRGGDLLMTIRRNAGAMARTIDWDLTHRGAESIVVFEIAGQNVQSTEIRLQTSTGDVVRRQYEPAPDFSSYQFISIRLKPARYTQIEIVTKHFGRTGRIALHGYRVYSLDDSEDVTTDRKTLGANADG